MTSFEKLAFVKKLIDDVPMSDEQVLDYLAVASDRIMNRLYPFGTTSCELPSRYDITQCELAVRMIARRGGEGESSHSENGISRAYGSVDDEDILRRITPHVGVF